MTIDADKEKDAWQDGRGDAPREYSSPPCYRHELDPAYVDAAAPMSMGWSAVRDWRVEQRRRIIALRERDPGSAHAAADAAIVDILVREQVLAAVDTGVYWPLRGEFDSRPLMDRILAAGGRVGIPVIVAPNTPLEFWHWDHATRMQARGPWGIPAPAERQLIDPSMLVIPLVGFDADGHRLGNGGGYFDRTLAALDPRPVTIGVGYEIGRLDTIHPQTHDVPLDAIVTERGITWHRSRPGT